MFLAMILGTVALEVSDGPRNTLFAVRKKDGAGAKSDWTNRADMHVLR
jgi:hypothetical protein